MKKSVMTRSSIQTNSANTKGIVQLALFAAIIIVMAFTPFLGYIPIGFTRATIIHIPVIIGSLLLGPRKGASLGFIFGLTSFINNTLNPTVTSFVFTPFYTLGQFRGGIGSLIICFVPRVLVGILPFYVYRWVKKVSHKKGISNWGLILAGISGALVNTILVMNFIFVFFRDEYASSNGIAANVLYRFILSIIGINGIPEAIAAGILTFGIGRVLLRKNIRESLGLTDDFSN